MIMTAHGQNEHRTAFDIVWTIDLGAGMDRNGVLSKRRLEPPMRHLLHFDYHAETMQYIQMKGYAGNLTTQIVDYIH